MNNQTILDNNANNAKILHFNQINHWHYSQTCYNRSMLNDDNNYKKGDKKMIYYVEYEKNDELYFIYCSEDSIVSLLSNDNVTLIHKELLG